LVQSIKTSHLANIKEDLEEGTFKYHMDKAVAANDRGDVNRKKFHLSNAKQARYALKSTDIPKHKDLLDKYKSMTEGTNLEEGRGLADKINIIALLKIIKIKQIKLVTNKLVMLILQITMTQWLTIMIS
jgi:hypothetical protein